jgi:hypothetical protein
MRQPIRPTGSVPIGHFESMQSLEPRVVLDGDWTAADGAGVFGSWGDGGYLTVTTIDLNNEPIVFEQVSGGGGDDVARTWQQIALLTSDDGASGADTLGRRSLAVRDDRMIIGAPEANGGAGAAAVFRYQRATGAWAFETLLTSPDAQAGDGFGWSVDMHGSTAVVGSRAGNAAWIFRDSGGWSLQATLAPTTGQEGRFGFSVATDGSIVAVGAPGEEMLDGDATVASGGVYIFSRDGNSWDLATRVDAPESARDSEFGHSVAVHSSNVIVGAWLDDDMGEASGSVFALGRDGRDWEIEAKLTPGTHAPGARFGYDVAASGSRAAAISLSSEDGSVLPQAQVFKRRGDRWSLEATLAPAGGDQADQGWRSVAFQGDRVALGTDSGGGAAVVFRKIDETDAWVLETTLTPGSEAGAHAVGFDVALHDRTVVLGGRIAGGEGATADAAAWVFGSVSGSDDSGDDHGGDRSRDGDDDDEGDDNSDGRHGGRDDDDRGGDDDGDDSGDDHGGDDDDSDDDHGRGNDDPPGDDNGGGNDDPPGDDNGGDDSSGGDDSPSGSRWVVRSLGVLPGVGAPLSDLLTWTDPKDGQTYAAVATAQGLMLFTRSADRAAWSVRNLTAEISGAGSVVGDISVFGTRNGRVSIVGYTEAGELVIYRQSGAGAAGAFGWTFENITAEHLRPRGFETPRFAGGVVTFVTEWSAFNIAGLDSQGRIRAVWTAPGMDHWRADDLSASSGAPALDGKLAVFLTSWGGINLAGTDESGALTVTWWVPGFKKWVVSDFNALFDGPRLEPGSVSAFVAPWGALNITGTDDHGDVVAYWWTPDFGQSRDDDYWRVSNLTAQITASEQPQGALHGLVTPDGEINLFGTNALNDVLRYHWEPGHRWRMENLTHTAVPA